MIGLNTPNIAPAFHLCRGLFVFKFYRLFKLLCYMSARLQDQSEWNGKFMRGLPGPYKTFWIWLKSACDHGGVWEVDIEMARMLTGQPTIEIAEAVKLFNSQIFICCDGDKWLLINFCEEQFKTRELNPANTYHRGAIRILEKIGAFENKIYFLKNQSITQQIKAPSKGAKEKIKIKDKLLSNVIMNITDKEDLTKSVPKGFKTPYSEAFKDFREMRQKMRKPLTERAAGMIHTKLTDLAGDNEELKIAILNQSILKGWDSVYELKEDFKTKTAGVIDLATQAKYTGL